MSISVITGADVLGKYIEGADKNVLTIVKGVESMNSPRTKQKIKGMKFLDSFIKELEGVQGHTEGFKEYRVFASDDGDNQDGVNYQEDYKTWTYERRGYIVKDKDFSHQLLLQAYEENLDLTTITKDRMVAIADMYLNYYLPNRAYETLFTVGTEGATYYGKPEGFLYNTVVDTKMLKPEAQSKTTRMHYWGVEDASAGVSIEDIEAVVEYLSQYTDISDGNIVGLGTRGSLFKLKNTLGYEGNKDEFARTGQPTTEIAGVQFMANDFMPKGMIMFIAGEADKIITKLVSPKKDLRGMAAIRDKGFGVLSDLNDMVGTYFKIMPEGWHLTGRHYGLILDLENDGVSNSNIDAVVNRQMAPAGFTRLASHKTVLRNEWYRNLR